METRSFSEERAIPVIVKDAEGNDTRTIEGYAVVFEKESRMMFDFFKGKKFIEIIRRGSVTEEDIKKWDIKALAEHDRSRLLARSYNGTGSLSLSVDDYGVKYRFDAPNTAEGNNAIELIKRRDIFGSSFAFTADEQTDVKYTKRSDGSLLREVNKLSRMYDIAIVTDPAYFGTDVTVRSFDGILGDETPADESYKQDIENLRSLTK